MLNFFEKGKYVLHYENLRLYLRLGLKLKSVEAEKNGDKDGKALYKLMNNTIYGKTKENLRNRINLKFVNNEKDYIKYTSKPSYMSI